MGDEEPYFGARDGPFPILGQSTTATKPCKRSLDYPSTGEKFEALYNIGSLDDLQRPLSDFVQRTSEFGACISAVGEDMSKPRKRIADRIENYGSAIPILDVGTMDGQPHEQSRRVGDDMALTSVDFLARIVARRINAAPPFSAPFTL